VEPRAGTASPIYNPRAGRDLVREPIHDYIWFTTRLPGEDAAESDLINNRWVQRLRRIHLLQTAWLVYPSATHCRFSHSLGAMHVAGEMARYLAVSLQRQAGAVPKGFQEYIPDPEDVVETARIYGLLHDIGHGPFGHLLDQVWLKPAFSLTHEDIGVLILDRDLTTIVKGLRRTPDGTLSEGVDLDLLRLFIRAQPPAAAAPFWQHALSQALSGLYSPDKIDYLSRDSYFCGTPEYGRTDSRRLCLHSFVDATEVKGLALHASAEAALADFIAARLAMYDSVYFHRTVRAADSLIGALLPPTLGRLGFGDPREDLDQYWLLDEWYLQGQVRSWHASGDRELAVLAERWDAALSHPSPLRQAYEWKLTFRDISEIESLFLDKIDQIRVRIEERVRAKLPATALKTPFTVDLPALDVKPFNPLTDQGQVAIFHANPDDSSAGTFDTRGVGRLLAGLPVKFVACRIFTAPENVGLVRLACEQALGTGEGVARLQDTLF
jgi:hypothetical protein